MVATRGPFGKQRPRGALVALEPAIGGGRAHGGLRYAVAHGRRRARARQARHRAGGRDQLPHPRRRESGGRARGRGARARGGAHDGSHRRPPPRLACRRAGPCRARSRVPRVPDGALLGTAREPARLRVSRDAPVLGGHARPQPAPRARGRVGDLGSSRAAVVAWSIRPRAGCPRDGVRQGRLGGSCASSGPSLGATRRPAGRRPRCGSG